MINEWFSGKTKVQGIYCDQPISGVIIEGRGYPTGKKLMLTIKLDQTIIVYGQIRNQVTVDNDQVVSA